MEISLLKIFLREIPCIVKERFTKAYRHECLDRSLTQQRLKSEARAMLRCRMKGICTPAVFLTDLDHGTIIMEKIENSVTIQEYINNCKQKFPNDCALQAVICKIGETIGQMHKNNIIHGDLTTSNILLRGSPSDLNLVFIDFGLSHFENNAEDKGVDLYVLERALLSTHPDLDTLFESILNGYKKGNTTGHQEVILKLEEVRLRGRKRTMVG